MKKVFDINRNRKFKKFDCFSLTEIKRNLFSIKKEIISNDNFLPEIIEYLKKKKDLTNEFEINLMVDNRLVDKITLVKNQEFGEQVILNIINKVFPEILDNLKCDKDILEYLYDTYKFGDNYSYAKDEYNKNFSNYWYLESCIINNEKHYKLAKIVEGSLYIIVVQKNIQDIIDNTIRALHKKFSLGPNAYVVLNEWNNNFDVKKLPLKFNTNSLLKILFNKKVNDSNTQINKQPYIVDLQIINIFISFKNLTIYVGETNKIKALVEKCTKEGDLLTCAVPIEFDISKGYTMSLMKKIENSINKEIPSRYKNEDFQIKFCF